MPGFLNYSLWKDDHKTILDNLKHKQVLMTYSGGKDSSIILSFIQKAAQEFDFNFETHAVPFPHHVFFENEQEKLDRYWQKRGISIHWHQGRNGDEKLAEALENQINPCTICNQTKKEILVRFFKENKIALDQTVIIVNYSLWDLVSATTEHILNNIYRDPVRSNTLAGKKPEDRFIETSQRFYPFLTIDKGLIIFKPLIKYNDQDILQAVEDEKIPVTETICRYHEYRPKRWFAKYYHAAQLRFDYDGVLAFAKKSLNLPESAYFENIDLNKYLGTVF
jgi:tRNA(Ile)-lysidine synthase TilS/MesJ